MMQLYKYMCQITNNLKNSEIYFMRNRFSIRQCYHISIEIIIWSRLFRCTRTTSKQHQLEQIHIEQDHLISQANITLNFLYNTRTNPKLSAYSYIFGNFNFMAMLLALLGTKVIRYTHPKKQGLQELNKEVGQYVDPSMNHFRYVQYYFPFTRDVKNYDTVKFFYHEIPFLNISLKDHFQ